MKTSVSEQLNANSLLLALIIVLYLGDNAVYSQWTAVNNGLNIQSAGAFLLGSSGSHIFTRAGGYFRSNTNGDSWSAIPNTGGFATSTGVSSIFHNGKFFVGFNGPSRIHYTTDNGATWTEVATGPDYTNVRGFLIMGNDLFAYTNSKGVFKSSDGGLTWTAANSGLTNSNIASMATINNKLIALTEGSGIFVSTNAGNSWQPSNTGLPSNLQGSIVWVLNGELYCYAIVGNQYFKSTNEGSSWTTTSIPAFLQSSLASGIVKTLQRVVRVGTRIYYVARTQQSLNINDSIFVTSNEGATWTNITANLPANKFVTGLLEHNGYIFVSFNDPGTGIYRRPISGLVNLNENEEFSVKAYPNPFYSELRLISDVPASQVTIYDLSGRKVSEFWNPGDHLDLNHLLGGVYTMEVLTKDGRVFCKKIIKIN
ncbi:MAG: T9SS type A sorting domain-containing protein [Thermaurantimonas sp.]|uniref:T9SS type A sorting domain-containing protein n=1 Tax=Thermaurantimonas sp. TaxID=2681568 RepID=UPI0039187149